jgi:hypothetical protein
MLLLREWLTAAIPPLVFLGPPPGANRGHFVVVTGISGAGRHVRLHSDRHPDQWWGATEFENRWRAGGFHVVLTGPNAAGSQSADDDGG